MSFTLAELAQQLGAELQGDPETRLHDVAGLREAGPGQLTFLANPRYRRFLAGSRAGAVLLRPGVAYAGTALRLSDPYAAFAQAATLFHPPLWGSGGVDPRAAVADTAQLGPDVRVEAFAVVEDGAVLGEGCWIQAGAYVGAQAQLGAYCRLMPGSVLMDQCVLGDRVWLNPGAVVGAQGFGFAPTPQGMLKIPQVGRAVVESDVEIGANSCVDRAAMGETRVGHGSKLDNLVQVGHAAQVGPHNILVAYSGVAGSARLGVGVTLAARATVLGHIELGDGVTAAAHSMVAQDTPGGARVAGVPAQDHKRWLRASRASQDAHELQRELRALRAEIQAIKASLE